MNNIILIGMPGSGKTTLGKELAQKVNYDFLDIDQLITVSTNKKLYELLDERGNDGFMRLENYFLKKIQIEKTVIAPGGSCIYHEEGMQNLEKQGTIVYLKVSLNEIKYRLGDFSKRGIILQEGGTIEQLYKERNSLYMEYAQHIISGDKINTQDIINIVRPGIGLDDHE